MNPGDTRPSKYTGASSSALNEGRGMNPGDTLNHGAFGNIVRTALNEGRGMNPGDTRLRIDRSGRSAALNEGRGMNPGDTPDAWFAPRAGTALNEGRGMNPGDTDVAEREAAITENAQRRPGHEPRRHRDCVRDE